MVIRIYCVISNDWIVTDYGGCDIAGTWIAMHIKWSSRLSNLRATNYDLEIPVIRSDWKFFF